MLNTKVYKEIIKIIDKLIPRFYLDSIYLLIIISYFYADTIANNFIIVIRMCESEVSMFERMS